MSINPTENEKKKKNPKVCTLRCLKFVSLPDLVRQSSSVIYLKCLRHGAGFVFFSLGVIPGTIKQLEIACPDTLFKTLLFGKTELALRN